MGEIIPLGDIIYTVSPSITPRFVASSLPRIISGRLKDESFKLFFFSLCLREISLISFISIPFASGSMPLNTAPDTLLEDLSII